MKVYTKTGDKGETSLFGGKRVKKYHHRIEAYGTVDELNSWVGLLRDMISDKEVRQLLLKVQDRLFTLGAHLASEKPSTFLPELSQEDITVLEKAMDAYDSELPPMRHFVLPGGHPIVSNVHIARCVCRRAERLVVQVGDEISINPLIIQYLNRLSDYLFMLSRYMGLRLDCEENPWIPDK
ncbi:MAG: cob(I)yrinic acid a,c-diamide adenosyltransferase [Flavobacteriales bacterium]|jgi:cob(I)alamin adenosyltransferase|nr:cob(I)yrinic acid a,c-diamide adenosyltransferase [Flavobacteriales bacterium]